MFFLNILFHDVFLSECYIADDKNIEDKHILQFMIMLLTEKYVFLYLCFIWLIFIFSR